MNALLIALACIHAASELATTLCLMFYVFGFQRNTLSLLQSLVYSVIVLALTSYAGFAFALSPQQGERRHGLLTFVCASSAIVAVSQAPITAGLITGLVYGGSSILPFVISLLFSIVSLISSLAILTVAFVELARSTMPLVGHYIFVGLIAACASVMWALEQVFSSGVITSYFATVAYLTQELPGQLDFALVVVAMPPALLILRALFDKAYSWRDSMVSVAFSIALIFSCFAFAGLRIVSLFDSFYWNGLIQAVGWVAIGACVFGHIIASLATARRFHQSAYSPLLPETHLKDLQGGYSGQE